MPRPHSHDLPEERTPATSARELAALIVLTVCGFAAVNFALAAFLQSHPVNRGHELARQKWRLLTELAAPVETLIVGDSSGNQGLIPERLSQHLDGESLNLCTTASMGVAHDAWILGAYVERFGPPRRIVAVHVYDVWGRDDSALRAMAWTIADHRELWQRQSPQLTWSPHERLLLATGRFLPFYTSERTLRALLAHPRRLLQREKAAVGPRGFMAVETPRPEDVQPDAAGHLRWIARSGPPRLSAANRDGLRALAELSRLHDVPLYVVFSPLYHGLWEDARFREHWHAVADALEKELAAAPGARVLLRSPVRFSAEQMENVDHVILDAARTYTDRVAEAIARAEGSAKDAG